LPSAFEEAVPRIAELGFDHVDVVGLVDRPVADLETLGQTPLLVSCAAVGRDLPVGQSLDAADVKMRRAALTLVKRQIDDASILGATSCYLTSGCDASAPGMMGFTDTCVLLAEHARQRMVRLCVEHIPGRALPTAASVLDWLSQAAHPNLYLLLDVGHCLITNEQPQRCIERAGNRLRYVHLDDNDGKGDLHWPLLSGLLKEADLVDLLSALQTAGYDGALTLELNPANDDPEDGLRQGKVLMERLLGEML
jgi:sugar phosphate isomerase/epimerase